MMKCIQGPNKSLTSALPIGQGHRVDSWSVIMRTGVIGLISLIAKRNSDAEQKNYALDARWLDR